MKANLWWYVDTFPFFGNDTVLCIKCNSDDGWCITELRCSESSVVMTYSESLMLIVWFHFDATG
jgi:hypothetical protein